jgi:hypothetical protein
LRRLPRAQDVVFGIRTHIAPLSEVIDGPEAAAALLQRLDEMPGPMQTYKNLMNVKPALITFLKQRQA